MAIPAPARAARGPARLASGDPLRDGLFQLFGRSFALAEKATPGSGRAIYRYAARAIHELCGQPWAQATIFPGETQLVQLFMRETRLHHPDAQSFVQMALMANAWAPAWTGMLLKANTAEFDAYCQVRGEQHLREALAGGKGVVLAHAHTLFAQLFWRWLEHRKIPDGITLWQWTWSRSKADKEDPKLRAIESAREMHAASHLLRDGGIVHSLADGRWGGDRLAIPFHNRMRVFQPSFAELALKNGSPVLTVDVIIQAGGRIRMDIGAPLAVEDERAGKDEKIETLVRAYARHLAGRWSRYASNLEWFQMRRHLGSPKLGSKS